MKRDELKRGKPLARGRGVRRANPRRRKASYARNFGEEADRVRALPCLVCKALPSDPAHVTSRGAGGGRFDLVPLCRVHHDQQHLVGAHSFAGCYRLDLRAEADRVALLHEAPLGVRGLAQRWAAATVAPPRFDPEVLADIRAALVLLAGPTPVESLPLSSWPPQEAAREQLDTYEREALLGWVRRRMERERDERYGRAFDDIDAAFSEALAHAVMADLGLALDQARALCEETGWPS